ncbi:MAG TPA: aminopeptidase P family protein [Candidatus Acidoferrales bacterium]|nr:aminopeptidase P family protein [Candidatus Acidoferrales bacterium]
MPTATTRLARLRRLAGRDLDALLLTHLPHLLYLVGFRGSSGVLAVTRRSAVFFAPALYRLQARQEVVGAQVQLAAGDPLRAAALWLRRQRPARVAYEAEHLTVAQLEHLRSLLGGAAELVPAGKWVARLRAVKEAEEVARIREALELTARVFTEVLPHVRPGVRELDLAAEIDYRMKLHGASGPAFETIVASGPRAALPHGRASRKPLAKNELVIFDLGAILADYRGDMTRTVYLGTPSARVKRSYGAVQDALARARDTVRAGVPLARVDAAARRCLARRGLGEYFVHGTGHGLGLEVHEEPRVVRNGEGRLREGNVITLEPGVYLPGWGGIRIEDVVVVRRRGAELLTPLSTELICL